MIRPRSSTAVASIMTSPAPDMACVMVFCRCQSVGIPPIAEYWHIGETATRFGAIRGPSATVVKSADIPILLIRRRFAVSKSDVELWIKRVGRMVSSQAQEKTHAASLDLCSRQTAAAGDLS